MKILAQPHPLLRLGVLASHNGSTLQAILDACASGRLAATVPVVISNNSRSRALTRAQAAGVATHHLSSATHPDAAALDRAIEAALASAQVDVVVLAGYMKKLGSSTLARYQGRVINTHPALLPKFGGEGMYGDRVHAAVLAAGERVSGCTVHLVDAGYDTGAPLAQTTVVVEPGDTTDTLSARVQLAEKALLISVLVDIAASRVIAGQAL